MAPWTTEKREGHAPYLSAANLSQRGVQTQHRPQADGLERLLGDLRTVKARITAHGRADAGDGRQWVSARPLPIYGMLSVRITGKP